MPTRNTTSDVTITPTTVVKEAVADGFGIYPDLAMLDWQQFWGSLKELGAKYRKT